MSAATRITSADYEHMIASGEFDGPNQKRIEPIHGELRDMSPIGGDHQNVVDWLLEWSFDVANLRRSKSVAKGPWELPSSIRSHSPALSGCAAARSVAARRPKTSTC